MTTPVRVTPSPVDGVIEEIRVAMARRRWNQRALADAVGEPEHWVSRRLNRRVDISVGELFRIAEALGVSAQSLLPGKQHRSPCPVWPQRERRATRLTVLPLAA